MKFTLIIDPNREEEVVVYAHEASETIDALRQAAQAQVNPLMGYDGADACLLDAAEITRCFSEGDRVYALVAGRRWQVRCRLYELEAVLPAYFVRIHKSCIANLRRVKRFSAAFSGTLQVHFDDGHVDYVSRRQMRAVKERLGMK